jgi:hypothetical protein
LLFAPHVAAGIAVARYVRHPVAAVGIAVGSHFLLDLVPHWQEVLPPYRVGLASALRVPVDTLVAVLLIRRALKSARSTPQRVWLCSAAASAPDLDAVLFLWPWLTSNESTFRRYWRWHIRIQRETGSVWGLLPQVGLILLAYGLSSKR